MNETLKVALMALGAAIFLAAMFMVYVNTPLCDQMAERDGIPTHRICR